MSNKSNQSEQTAAIKEVHNIAKTKVLLLRDLPFITQLSKYYDKDILNSNNYDLSNSNKTYSSNFNKTIDKNQIDKRAFNRVENQGNQSDFADIQDSHITNTANNSNEYENREDKLTKALRAQLDYNADEPISQEYLESIKRLKEIGL
jgi:hypothetical protein